MFTVLPCDDHTQKMTSDQDLPMDNQSATAVFAARGIDVTPNKDQGVIKVFIVIAWDSNF